MKTRTILLLSVAWLASVALASSLRANTITPPGPAVANGSALLVAPGMTSAASHPLHWTINVLTSGRAKTTSSASPASPVTFTNLPWKWKPGVGQALTIHMTWGVPGFPPCDATVPLSLQNGTIGLNYANATSGCEFIWGGVTSPTLTVAP